jgi:4-alpha-glucanotransferase
MVGDETEASMLPKLGDRASGILLHFTSLPGPHGCGDLGAGTRAFLDFLHASGQAWWQMLPVGPPGYGNCPYMASSSLAINPHLLDLDELFRRLGLPGSDLGRAPDANPARLDYEAMRIFRDERLHRASRAFFAQAGVRERSAYQAFCAAEEDWLEDYALFCACKDRTGGASWTTWDPAVRRREPAALARAREDLQEGIRHHSYMQYELMRQWSLLRLKASERGVGLIGDIPIFVAHECADVWANPEVFCLDEAGQPTVVAGVPPDYFSPTGQRWGHPLYRWEVLRERGYDWWMSRFRRALDLFDVVRIDHFIGLHRYWEIPASSPTAEAGRWMPGPGEDFFNVLLEQMGQIPVIAEDLGLVTDAVVALRERFRLPGMRVLQFAFGGDPRLNDHLPHRHDRRCVVYTGTHDNDTTLGWYHDLLGRAALPAGERGDSSGDAARREKELLFRYLGGEGGDIAWEMIRLAESSVADLAVIPAQDILGLGSQARMNLPSAATGNWEWRMLDGALTPAMAEKLRLLTYTFGRLRAREERP